MARDYDRQLLESVTVRRRRMRDALLFGGQRARRSLDEKFGKVLAGMAIAAVMCAGCVGWSFISDKLAGRSPANAPVQPSTATSSTPAVR